MRAQLTSMEEKNLIEWLENQNEEPISSVKEQNITKDNQKCPSCQRKVAQALTELGECDNFATWTEKSEKTWEENIFTNPEIVVGNPLATKDEIVKVVLVGKSEANMDRGVQKIYRDRYPELEHIKEDFGMLEQDFRIRTKTTNTTKTRKIIKITHNETEEDLYNKISDLKTELVTEEGVILHKVECMQQTRFRKMVEAIFHGTSTAAYIYTNKKLDTASEKPRRQGRDSYASVVENAGKTFSESLTEIKAILKTNNAEKGIRGIRSTREGKLLITTEKDKQTTYTHTRQQQASIEAIDKNGNVYFPLLITVELAKWDPRENYEVENFEIIANDKQTMQFPTALKIRLYRGGPSEALWMFATAEQRYEVNKLNGTVTNFRLFVTKL
ncbi:unnamed protein product [Ceutorhynchus assimilis]|uniref:Uncharacterized protein n=1 Tax=Ceutorhynchus assimilis TaxID=467358 RepID=A0A9N9QPC1_9CUCU|nr:unnamed protein product [Ceutorhynchus assimilis]